MITVISNLYFIFDSLSGGVMIVDEMLAKILEMDKKCRLQAEEAEEAQKKALNKLTSVRTSLIEEKLAEAQKKVAAIRDAELEKANEESAELGRKAEAAQEKLKAAYAENGKKWIDDIFNKAIE
jgi:V/A-type H+/Na+-transporting ATPase subunit G/H